MRCVNCGSPKTSLKCEACGTNFIEKRLYSFVPKLFHVRNLTYGSVYHKGWNYFSIEIYKKYQRPRRIFESEHEYNLGEYLTQFRLYPITENLLIKDTNEFRLSFTREPDSFIGDFYKEMAKNLAPYDVNLIFEQEL